MYWIIQHIQEIIFISIFSLLFYDHRKNMSLAFKYLIGFIVFVLLGVFSVLNYHIYVIILAPIFIWGYFFIQLLDTNIRNKKKLKKMKSSSKED